MSGSILSKESQQALFGYNGSRHCTEIPGEVKYFTWIHSFQIEKFVEKLYKSRQANFLDPDFPKSAPLSSQHSGGSRVIVFVSQLNATLN